MRAGGGLRRAGDKQTALKLAHRREYCERIGEAKRAATATTRVAQTVDGWPTASGATGSMRGAEPRLSPSPGRKGCAKGDRSTHQRRLSFRTCPTRARGRKAAHRTKLTCGEEAWRRYANTRSIDVRPITLRLGRACRSPTSSCRRSEDERPFDKLRQVGCRPGWRGGGPGTKTATRQIALLLIHQCEAQIAICRTAKNALGGIFATRCGGFPTYLDNVRVLGTLVLNRCQLPRR